MSSSRTFDWFARRFLLGSLGKEDRDECLRDPNLRELTKFRVSYLMTFQAPVLTPLLILLADHNGLELALLSLGVARLTMVVFEFPMGVVADVFGPKRAAQAGLLLMACVMLGFFGLAVFCAAASQIAVEYRVGAIGIFVLQFLFGCAFALINGADDSLTEAVFHASPLAHLSKKQVLALGKTIRYAGGMVAVGVGAAWFQMANVAPLTPPTRLVVQSGVFLATFVCIVAALVSLGRIGLNSAEPSPASDRLAEPGLRPRLRAHRRDLGQAVAFAFADKTLPLSLWWLSTLLAVVWFAAYSLQSPVTDLTAALTKESPLWMGLFVVQALIGQWASSLGGRRLFDDEKRGDRVPPMASDELRQVGRVLSVVVAALVLMAVCKGGLTLLLFTVMVVASVLCYFVRGVAEPLTSSLLGTHADQCNLEVRNALRSMNNAFVGCCFFVQVLLFGFVGSAIEARRPGGDLALASGKAWQTAITSALFVGIMAAGFLVLWLVHRRRPKRSHPPQVVVIGSYRDDFPGLLKLCRALAAHGYRVLHPKAESVVVGEDEGFVRLDTDPCQSIAEIQRRVFGLIDRSDLVVLYCPTGRVGTSAATELGYALKCKRAILPTARLTDVTLRELVGSPDRSFLTNLGVADEPTVSGDS